AITFTPTIAQDCFSCADGSNKFRYSRNAVIKSAGAKCEAKPKGNPIAAASCALNVLEPNNQIGTCVPAPGIARTRWPSSISPKYFCSSKTSSGKLSALEDFSRRNARIVNGSVPGARPNPKSILPG